MNYHTGITPVATEHATTYRPDVDGLRAVAVLSVILFHAHTWLPGGFVGVDIFFVISGFVITLSLFGYQGSLGSMLRQFYERRIRRLFPASVLVALCTSLMAWHVIPPGEFAEYGQSLLAFTTFWSNWFFASLDGYFDTPSALKPLLHTWSLSIEEQFYILLPLPILLVMKRGRVPLAILFAAITVVSFAISVWLVAIGGTDAAFFNSFGRFWEIALGGLLASILLRPRSQLLASSLGAAGALAIGLSLFLVNDRTPFPGFWALLPTLGTAAIICAGRGPVNQILAKPPVVWIGKISYGLYLWHWPIFVTIGYTAPNATDAHYAGGIAATFAAATASYYLLEQPIRRRKWLPKTREAFALFLVGAAVIAAGGWVTHQQQGFRHRLYAVYPETAQSLEASARQEARTFTGDPEGTKPVIAIVGDSYATNWSIALNRLIDHERFDVLSVSYLGCNVEMGSDLTATATKPRYEEYCQPLVEALNDRKITSRIKAIFLVSHRPFEYKANKFRFDLIKWIISKSTSDPDVLIFGGYYQLDRRKFNSCLNLMFQTSSSAKSCLDLSNYPSRTEIEALPLYPKDLRFTYIDPIQAHCGYDRKTCRWEAEGVPFMIDWNHLTATFLTYLLKDMMEKEFPGAEKFKFYMRHE